MFQTICEGHFLRVLGGHIWDLGVGEAHGGVAIVFGFGGLGVRSRWLFRWWFVA